MTSAAEGMELTQVGAGTVMGELMRQYWIPAAQSSELVRDGAPVRLMLLGEKLIAFRDSAGRVGVMDHRCPHRCASLFLGRNEEGGIRCIYHGWKFDVAGNCVDMASVPPHQDFKHKVKAKAYPAVERAGVVWVYMGSSAEAPPLPALEILDVPDDEISVTFIQRECNYLQAIEGEIDTSHFGFLHAGHVDPDDVSEDDPVYNTIINRAPEYHIADTRLGHAIRRLPPGRPRTAPIGASPTSCFRSGPRRPTASSRSHVHARAWVPLDDGHTMFCFLRWKRGVSALTQPQPAFKDGTADRRHRARQQVPAEHHRLARPLAARRECGATIGGSTAPPSSSNAIYSGIDGIHLQDQAITESMGPVTDHAFEHLAPSDQMITRTRRRLLMAARALRDKRVAAARRRGRRGLSRRAQRLFRQRRQEPVAGALCGQATGGGGAPIAGPAARGEVRSAVSPPDIRT